MKKIILIFITTCLLLSLPVIAGYVYYYKDSDGYIYRICRDNDGFIIYKPGGGQDSWGNGYSWRDVKESYGLGNSYKKSSRYYNSCP